MVEEQLPQRGITETEETCSYEELSHTADVGIRLQANAPAVLFACAGQAMFKLAGAVVDDGSLATPRFVTVEAGDAESLMVAWLNELLYQHEVNREVYLRCAVTAWEPTRLEAIIHGYRPAQPPILYIKAVTFHQLRVAEKEDGGWTAEIYGVISPGAIGYDINCGVRLLASELDVEEVEPYLDELATTLYNTCPSGVGRGGRYRLSSDELDEVLATGARWCRKYGLATDNDLIHTEASGCIEGADPACVSDKAHQRGRDQLGTLGAGNHFLEVDVVAATYDETIADAYGLRPGQIVMLIHCGSRGLGHQVCTDYVHQFQRVIQQYQIKLPDRELVCAPFNSPEGEAYTAAMRAAANFAFANRQTLVALVRESFTQVLANSGLPFHLRQVYDVAHNIAKVEAHVIDGRRQQVCVHRKGATRAFGPGHDEIPLDYREVGQPVLVPGSMGTASYVLAGTAGAMRETFGSTCHGAGRTMSRTRARKQVRGDELKQELKQQGILVRAGSMRGLSEEAPFAYKEVEAVIEAVAGAGIARVVARLEPLAVIKG